MNRTLADFARACGGELGGPDRAYTGVSSDTRSLRPGELFVALRGPRFNANEFVGAAEAAGAAGAVVDTRTDRSIAQILVGDTLEALTNTSATWRAGFDLPVVGVAGSNGKTTVKEMTAAILARTGNTLATRGSLNNHIGVPLTLHRLDATHRFAVIEIGANHPGEVGVARASSRARRWVSSPTPARSISKGSAASRARPAPRARWSPISRPATRRCSTPTTNSSTCGAA